MHFAIGVTGHRETHPSFPAETSALQNALEQIFTQIDRELSVARDRAAGSDPHITRLLTLLASGTDHLAARLGLGRGWDLVAPLPFGRKLNEAINAAPEGADDIRAILAGKQVSGQRTAANLAALRELADQAQIFELADDDERLAKLLLATLETPDSSAAKDVFAAEGGQRAALAGKVMVEQADLLIAIWDGQSVASVGGTGHTMMTALELGSPVLWIDPAAPADWQIVLSVEALQASDCRADRALQTALLTKIITDSVALEPPTTGGDYAGVSAGGAESWQDRSTKRSHAFRRVEALFGGTHFGQKFASLRQNYEHPDQISDGSAAALMQSIRSLSDGDNRITDRIGDQILKRFAWFDGVSANLSDRHRSGMTVNFLLGAAAIIAGILYLPLVDVAQKWIFALVEFALLLAIVINTAAGRRLRLHGRWFETRRVAEYLRHSPVMSALGVSRPSGAWPRGTSSWWPEWYARQAIRAVGLPESKVDKSYLRKAMRALRDHHVDPQRHYHRSKSARLARVHSGLDRLAGILFVGAILAVATYLALALGAYFGFIDVGLVAKSAKWFTVLAVALPTLGGAFAGIRYFGDFERFSEISAVTAENLDGVAARIDALLNGPDDAVTYGIASDIAHATDEIVFTEIQNWQAVFGGKVIAIPA